MADTGMRIPTCIASELNKKGPWSDLDTASGAKPENK